MRRATLVLLIDQAEGQYWVINGYHDNSGCCFDYGNAETDSRDDGNGTMETTYHGNATKLCRDLPNITWRFVTAMAKRSPRRGNRTPTRGGADPSSFHEAAAA